MNNDEEPTDKCIISMKKRIDLLHLSTQELIEEYKDLVQDEYKMEHFMNYSRLNESFEYCEAKLNTIANDKMIAGLQNYSWNKVKYVHMLAQECGIKDDLFDFDSISVPDISSEKVQKLIDAIKILYNKRDVIKAEDYTQDCFVKLYKFMIDNLTKKLGLIKSTMSKGRDCRKHKYSIDRDSKTRYDKLISIKNTLTIRKFDMVDDE